MKGFDEVLKDVMGFNRGPQTIAEWKNTPAGREQMHLEARAKKQAINSRLAAMSVRLPEWMARNARRDVAAGINPIAAYTNAGSGGLVDPISGKVGDGIREQAQMTDYFNRQNALFSEMNGGVSYRQIMDAYRKAIGIG